MPTRLEVEVGVTAAERLQRGHLVVEHALGEVLAHLELEGRSASRGAGAVDDDDGEALVGQPLVGGERPGGMDDAGVVRAAVGSHDDGQPPRAGDVPRGPQDGAGELPVGDPDEGDHRLDDRESPPGRRWQPCPRVRRASYRVPSAVGSVDAMTMPPAPATALWTPSAGVRDVTMPASTA